MHVRAGFIGFMVLIVFINPTAFGVWLAALVALLTLVHELGHAFAARATGARAEITLDLFYGYAAFVPTRELRRWERAGISFAGPGAQLVVSVGALLAMGVNPLERASFTRSDVALALWWAGPLIAVLNLLPVLPLDGGHLVLVGLEALIGKRARRVMIIASIVLTAAGVVVCFVIESLRPLAIFAALPLLTQFQLLGEGRARPPRRTPPPSPTMALAAGEARAWAADDTSALVDGQAPSPWFVAHRHLQTGHTDLARDVLLAEFSSGRDPAWWPPDAAATTDLEDLVELLPEPLPTGNPYAEYVLSSVLLRVGRYHDSAHYAADAYGRRPAPSLAVNVSRAAAALGDRATALAWLRTALASASNTAGVRATLAQSSEFDALRGDPEFTQLLG